MKFLKPKQSFSLKGASKLRKPSHLMLFAGFLVFFNATLQAQQGHLKIRNDEFI